MFESGVRGWTVPVCAARIESSASRAVRALIALTALVGSMCVFFTVPGAVHAAVPANDRTWEFVTSIPDASSTRNLGLQPMGETGDRIVYATVGPAVDGPSGAMLGYGTAVREPSGWVTHPLGFPYRTESTEVLFLFAPILPVGFSDDGSAALWITSVPLSPDGQPEGKLGLYRSIDEGPPEFIAELGEGVPFGFSGFADISSDGSKAIFTSKEHILPGDAARTEGESVYEWDGTNVHLVDVDGLGNLVSTCGSKVPEANGMSVAADRVFFTVSAACAGLEKVYVRDLTSQETKEVSASQCTRLDCNAAAGVAFAGATRDGKTAFVTTTQQLTNADEDSARDLYSYDVQTGDLELLSGGDPATTGAVLEGVVYPSDDGSRVYFHASGELFPAESGTGEKIFVADSAGTRMVAEAAIPGFPATPEIQLSTDGGKALFVTPTELLPDDTDAALDAYVYDAETEALTRVSAGPSGGNGAYDVGIIAPEFINRSELETGDKRPYYAIDGSGERVFFQTKESLVPEDTNETFDIYEVWQGTIGLITPGYQSLESNFGGVSRDGRSLMFATNANLVPEDMDGEGRDLYDARLEGGFPPPPPPPVCDATSCPLPTGERVVRPTPSTTLPDVVKAGHLRVLSVASKARKGAIAVLVSVPHPGPVSGELWVRQGGKKAVLASGKTGATRSGKVSLSLQLLRAARRAPALVRKAHLTVSVGSSKVSKVVEVKLR